MSEIAVRQQASELAFPDSAELGHVMEVVRAISQTDFVPRSLRGNNPAILACVLYGREIGLGPMESLSEVHLIDGRPSLSAKAKLKRARQLGHDIWGEVDDNQATVHGKRGDNGREMTVTFTLKDAQRAGLTNKDNWKKHPQDMLWARAVSRLCKRLFTEEGLLTALDPDEAELTTDDKVQQALADLPAPSAGEPQADSPVERVTVPGTVSTPDMADGISAEASSPAEQPELGGTDWNALIPEEARGHVDQG